MEQDMLSEVIEAEKEIQKSLELERIKAREWLEGVKKEFEEQFLREEAGIKSSYAKSLDTAAEAAEAEAQVTVKRTTAKSELLRQLPEETLSRLVEKQILKILPNL